MPLGAPTPSARTPRFSAATRARRGDHSSRRGNPTRRLAAALVAALAVSAVASRARAGDFGFYASANVNTAWMPRMPATLDVSPSTDTALRIVAPGAVRLGGPNLFIGGGGSVGMTFRNVVLLSLLGFDLEGAVGASSPVVGGLDGSVVEADPSTMVLGQFTFMGLGARITQRRWVFELAASPMVAFAVAGVYAQLGAQTTRLSGASAAFGVRADLSACYRATPYDRLCLFVAPNLVEWGLMNGGSLGLRWEIGP